MKILTIPFRAVRILSLHRFFNAAKQHFVKFRKRHVAVIQDSRKRSLNSLKSYMVSPLIALTAAIAMFRFKRNVIEVICGLRRDRPHSKNHSVRLDHQMDYA